VIVNIKAVKGLVSFNKTNHAGKAAGWHNAKSNSKPV
jgi:hypothetical protein